MVRRVFLSHTSEFAIYPKDKSFVTIAVEAVLRAGCMPCDMEYFTARDQQPAQYCIDRVRECDVYVGIIGLRYGSPVRDRPEVSYTELEFEAASRAPAKTRLIFVLAPNAVVPAAAFTDMKFGERQERFRKKLSDSGIMCKSFTTFYELDKFLLHALMEAGPVASGARQKLGRIEWPKGKSPYPGLEWFDQDYAPLFFGRGSEVNDLVIKLSEPGGRFLIISGPSGSGKSSLVAAGLWQALVKEGRLPGSQSWRWLRTTPASDSRGPFASLAAALHHTFPKMTAQVNDLARTLASEPKAFFTHITPQLSQGQELVLFVDQLEELFTQASSLAEVQSFLTGLVMHSGDTQNRLRVITTIRSEFLWRLAETEPVRRTINVGFHVLVGSLSPIGLQDMIQKPATATDYTFEPGLVDTILDDAGKAPGHLPLVAYALKQLFELREQQSRIFTHAAYQAMGGVVGAISSKADQMIATLEQQSSDSFDRVFAELVHIERDRPPTCKRTRLSYFKGDEEANKIIQVLAGRECRVLVTADDKQETTVEVAHEELFSAWAKLKDWIDDNGEDLRDIDFQEEAARRWFETGCHLKELWRLERAQKIEKALARFKKTRSSQLDALLRPQLMLMNRLDDESLSHHDRLLIGLTLAEFGDLRDGIGVKHDLPAIVWIDVPEGEVTLEGSDRELRVNRFRMAKYPVTNDQFNAFLRAEDGYDNDEWWKDIERSLWRKNIERSGAQGKLGWPELNCPREMVSWYDAVAFCRWLSAKTAAKVRLPTEWEWQQAAAGGDPRREYPWKGEWDSSRCNNSLSQLSRTTAVGMYPLGATPHGILDMAGNVWEWCLNTYDQLDTTMTTSGERVLRGDSWLTDPESSTRWAPPNPRAHRVSNRLKGSAGSRFNDIGFRLAQDIEP